METEMTKPAGKAPETAGSAGQGCDKDFWYVLFVKTGHEERVRRQLGSFGFKDNMEIFTPTREKIIKLPDRIMVQKKAMFPGYLFVETGTRAEDFGFFVYRSKFYLQKILKVVRYGASFDIAMKEEERKALEAIMDQGRCVAASRGIIVGDRTMITEGPLMGQEGIIRRIDRHKRRAFLELPMFGQPRLAEVALTVVEKLP
jgi:transcriptional antiterminator NusG